MIMRKALYIPFAFAAMVFFMAACTGNKKPDDSITVNTPIDSKGLMIKKGWKNGDQIFVWIDDRTDPKPNFVLKYNGSAWENDSTAETSIVTPNDSGTFKCIYDGDVKITTDHVPYTYVKGQFLNRVSWWTFLTEIQLVITGLNPEDASKYKLSCDKFTTCDGFSVGEKEITATGTKGAPTQGISVKDGVAFVFATADYDADSFTFTLYEEGENPKVYVSSHHITERKGHGRIKSLTISSEKFSNSLQ